MSNYKFEIEIFEGNGGEIKKTDDGAIISPDYATEGICAWMYRGDRNNSYQEGQRFNFPEDMGKLCPWMIPNISEIIKILASNGSLPWKYENTPYRKSFDEEGVTTEFIRCIDPTDSGIVIKIIRRQI